MLLDGCKVCPEFQDIILSSTDANSYTADGHAASLSKEIQIKICTVIINSKIQWVVNKTPFDHFSHLTANG